jgi:hypothetical protein
MTEYQVLAVIISMFGILQAFAIIMMNAEIIRLRKQIKQVAEVLSVSVDLTAYLSKKFVDEQKAGKK